MTKILLPLLAGVGIATSVIPTAANSSTFDFGPLLSGSYAPGATFAQLSVSQTGFNVFNFTLTANNLNSLFTGGAFIGSMAVDTNPAMGVSNVSISNFSGNGVDGIFAHNGGGPTGGWDFRFNMGRGSNSGGGIHRLGASESASWTATFNSPSAVTFTGNKFALHVQGLTSAQGGSAWYGITPAVPEPEIYAMLAAGLGLIGFVAHRRKRPGPARA